MLNNFPGRLNKMILIGIPCFLLMSFSHECDKIGDGRYKVHFQTQGFEDYELVITNDQYTKILKDGSSRNGKLEWRENCILVLTDPSELKKQEPLVKKIEAGLGEQCIQLLRKKGKTFHFRTTRVANLNIVINEGKLIKLK